jgi:hypothetical protein
MAGADATTTADFRARLDALDISLFKAIKSQTKAGDRASLLALQAAAAERYGPFAYLEIGSHLGGSLQAFVRDERVSSIVSIDLRPEVTPDERGKGIPYTGNSTQRMLDNLAALPGADLGKVHTIDADARTLAAADVPVRPQLCFIDGEHTNESCLADARFCRSVVASDGVIAFHDSGLIFSAIRTFLAELRAAGVEHVAYPLPDSVFVIELAGANLRATAAMRRRLSGELGLHPAAALLARRASGIRPVRDLALRAWLSEVGVGRRILHNRRRRVGKRVKRTRRRLTKRAARAKRLAYAATRA